MIKTLVYCLFTTAIVIPGAQAQITATARAGYDDNPFRLSNGFNPEGASFLDTQLEFDREFDSGLSFDARLGRLFSENQDANQTSYRATLAYERDASLFGKDSELLFHLRSAGLDRTFVSRNTGQIGQFGGASIPDRFDRNSIELRARADVELTDLWTLRLQGDARHRAYESYESLGLSNLDYNQVFAHARLRYQADDSVDAQIGGSLGQRVYDDRRGRALNTGFINGTDLEFTYVNFDASWEYQVHPGHEIRLAYSFDVRDDNVSGYYDTSLHRWRLRYRYRPSWGNRFTAEFEHRDFDYDNIPAALILDEEEGVAPNTGTSLSLTYDRRIVDEDDREVWLGASVTYDDFSSPNTAFNYDRWIFRLGVEVEFSPFG